MIQIDFSGITHQVKKADNKIYIFDIIRKKWLVLTPEEQVRQYLLQYMIQAGYPKGMIAVEKTIKVGALNKRFDIIVYNRQHEPWMLIECKEPEVPITETTLHQLLNYQRTVQCRYWMLSNGHQHFCADAGNISDIKWLMALPPYEG
jgi:hypothetical protein